MRVYGAQGPYLQLQVELLSGHATAVTKVKVIELKHREAGFCIVLRVGAINRMLRARKSTIHENGRTIFTPFRPMNLGVNSKTILRNMQRFFCTFRNGLQAARLRTLV